MARKRKRSQESLEESQKRLRLKQISSRVPDEKGRLYDDGEGRVMDAMAFEFAKGETRMDFGCHPDGSAKASICLDGQIVDFHYISITEKDGKISCSFEFLDFTTKAGE